MTIDTFIQELLKRASEAGFEAGEAYYSDGDSFSVGVRKGEIEDYGVSKSRGLSFRGLYDGRIGYAYTEAFDEEAIEMLVLGAMANAKIIEDDSPQTIFAGSPSYQEINGFSPALEQVTAKEKIALVTELEKRVLERDKRVEQVEYNMIDTSSGEVRIVNSKGLNLAFRQNRAIAYAMPVVRMGEESNNALAFRAGRDFDKLDIDAIAAESVDEAISGLGGKPVQTGKYRIVLRNDIAAALLSTFSSVFSADLAQKGQSLLKGREGETIAVDMLTVMDDPLLEDGLASSPFDAEGVATYSKPVIENGVLKTLLHNLKTAAIDGKNSTGNASKRGASGPVDVAPSNFFIKPGEKPLEAILDECGDGLFITSMAGLHSGANPISGDFSVAVKGRRIDAGKLSGPVAQITIAGNFYQVLKDIKAIGSDLFFDIPYGAAFGAPSILIGEMSVAGD